MTPPHTHGAPALQDPPSADAPYLEQAGDTDAPALQAAPAARRDATFDILKGLSILEVMTHHTLSTGMRKFTVEHDAAWWTMATLSRILHFAVPTFLLVSAVLLARSVASKPAPDWRRFFGRRVQRTLMPYLVWSAGYIAFRLLLLRAESDVMPAQWSGPLFGSITVPSLLTPERLWINLFWGKAYFHIYFMVVLLQFSVAFPLLFGVMRALRLTFGGVVALGAAIQFLAFLGQRHWWQIPYPGSTVLWYCMPVLAGMWIGLNWNQWESVWSRWRWWFGVMAFGGLAVYLPLALMIYLAIPISSLLFNSGIAVYCLGVALLLLGLSRRLAKTGWPRRLIQPIGDRSIAFFLIHPLILFLLGGPKVTSVVGRLPAPTLALGLIMFGVTYALSEGSKRLRLDRFLFGR